MCVLGSAHSSTDYDSHQCYRSLLQVNIQKLQETYNNESMVIALAIEVLRNRTNVVAEVEGRFSGKLRGSLRVPIDTYLGYVSMEVCRPKPSVSVSKAATSHQLKPIDHFHVSHGQDSLYEA